jgi:hypothetical protein
VNGVQNEAAPEPATAGLFILGGLCLLIYGKGASRRIRVDV